MKYETGKKAGNEGINKQVLKKDNKWMTKGITTSIDQKRELYLNSRSSNDPNLNKYYKLYCKLLHKVIKEARILQYKKHLITSQNKTKTTWNIVKSETEKTIKKEDISSLNINGMLIQNQQTIASFFNNYFLTVAEKLMETNHIDKINQKQNEETLHYILRNCKHSYPNIKYRYTSTKEVEKIIKSLKTKNAQGYQLKFFNGVLHLLAHL